MRTPEQERDRLLKALDSRASLVAEREAWYSGDHPIPTPPPGTLARTDNEARAAFNAMARLAVTNMTQTVVDVPAEKLLVEGFRFGESPTSTDQAAWRIWQRNQLDADHILTNTEALKVGSAPVLVWPGMSGLAEVHVEDPAQAIVAYLPGSRRTREAALKRWTDDDGSVFVTLYTPTAIYKWGRADRPGAAGQWTERQGESDSAWPLPNPLGVVPMVEVRANHGLKASPFGGGLPEFQSVIVDQQRLNATVMGMLITQEHQAFRQRWASNWDYPTLEDGTTPDKAAMLRAAASGLWALQPSDDMRDVKVGEFSQADFRPFIDVIGMWMKVIAAKSGTAPHAFLLGDLVNVASDALARIDARMAAKVRRHHAEMADPWEEVMRLALAIEGDPKAADTSSSIVWADPVERTATEQNMSATTRQSVGAPKRAVFEALPGVDAQEAERWTIEVEAEALLAPEPVVPA